MTNNTIALQREISTDKATLQRYVKGNGDYFIRRFQYCEQAQELVCTDNLTGNRAELQSTWDNWQAQLLEA